MQLRCDVGSVAVGAIDVYDGVGSDKLLRASEGEIVDRTWAKGSLQANPVVSVELLLSLQRKLVELGKNCALVEPVAKRFGRLVLVEFDVRRGRAHVEVAWVVVLVARALVRAMGRGRLLAA